MRSEEPPLGDDRAPAASAKGRTPRAPKLSLRADAPSLVCGLQNLTDKAFGRAPASTLANAPRTDAQIVAAIAHDAFAFALVPSNLMRCREIAALTAPR